MATRTPLAYNQYVGTTTARSSFPVTFPYLWRAHVKVYTGYDLVKRTGTELTEGTDYTWADNTTIQTTDDLVLGTTLTIVRETPDNAPLVAWQDGSNLLAVDLNTSVQQNLYVFQEERDANVAAVDKLAATATTAKNAAAESMAASARSAEAAAEAATATAAAETAADKANDAVAVARQEAGQVAATAANALAVATAAVAPISLLQVLEPMAILSNRFDGIGSPGEMPFGVGPVAPSGVTFSGISQRDYYPMHLKSGSFC